MSNEPSKKKRRRRPHRQTSRRQNQPVKRRALAQRGLPVRSRGDAATVAVLEAAWEAANKEPDEFTHGFHTYAARMHPGIARECMQLAEGPVLDPFCGSGTILVEAMLAGRESMGVDLNPLALRVSETKTALLDLTQLNRFAGHLEAIAEKSETRVRTRVPVMAPLSQNELSWYEVHTVKELAGLREEILAVESQTDRRFLEMVLSAIVVKFSLQRADTSDRQVNKRIRKGLPTEFFLRRGLELCQRWETLAEAAGPDAPRPQLRLGDARHLHKVLPKDFEAGLVLTSPPYGGTYDYVDHHARRYPWLGLEAAPFESGEIGSRRRSETPGARKRWDRELGDSLKAMASVTRSGGIVVLLLGDGYLEGAPMPVDEQLQRLAPAADLETIAIASQPRPDWLGGAPRQEHLIALKRR